MKWQLQLAAAAGIVGAASGVEVGTLTLSESIHTDGIVLDGDEHLIAASAWNQNEIRRISLTTGAVETLVTTAQGPIDVAFGPDGLLYFTNWQGSTVSRTDTSDGTTSAFATIGLRGDGLAFDDTGDLWATQGWFDRIWRIEPDGSTNLVIDGSAGVDYPIGITRAPDGTFYVSTLHTGKIYEMAADGSTITELATVPGTVPQFRVGHVVYARGRLYAAGHDDHVIYEITLDGTVSILAGTGSPGTTDGDGATAQFRQPLGIEVSPDQRYLYVSEIPVSNTMRVIDLGPLVAVTEVAPAPERVLPVTPTPTRSRARIDLGALAPDAGRMVAEVVTPDGRRVRRLTIEPGATSLTWDTRDARGVDVPAGVYLVRIPGAGAPAKVVVER